MRALRNFIGGVSVDARTDARSEVVNPHTGEAFATAPISDAADIDAAYRTAAEAFETWRDTTPSERQRALLKIADALEAWAWVHPDAQAARPLDALTRERWEQVQVSGYEVKTSGPAPDGRLRQLVEIRVINRHTQVERVLRVEETWGWDEEAQRWWNYAGLPDLTAGPR